MTDLPSLRQSLDAHGLMAKKSFGQHFLLDLNVTRKIVRLAGPFAGDTVIEVGPGPGGLTRALIESDAGRVIAVEKDARFLPLLGELDDGSGRLLLVEGDALKVDERTLVEGPAHLVSNLPYNVGTALLIKWLTGPWTPTSMTLMFPSASWPSQARTPMAGSQSSVRLCARHGWLCPCRPPPSPRRPRWPRRWCIWCPMPSDCPTPASASWSA